MPFTTYDVLAETTRVWIYQSNRPFRKEDLPAIRQYLRQFVSGWVSHNRELKAFGDVLHDRFIVLMVDESAADASGCSIDKSVAFLKALQAEYGVDLFDRMAFTFLDGDRPETVDRETFERLFREGRISDDTMVFDTLVDNKGDFDRNFVKPLGKSWHKRLV